MIFFIPCSITWEFSYLLYKLCTALFTDVVWYLCMNVAKRFICPCNCIMLCERSLGSCLSSPPTVPQSHHIAYNNSLQDCLSLSIFPPPCLKPHFTFFLCPNSWNIWCFNSPVIYHVFIYSKLSVCFFSHLAPDFLWSFPLSLSLLAFLCYWPQRLCLHKNALLVLIKQLQQRGKVHKI